MRVNHATTMGGRWRKIVGGGTLLLMGLAGVSLQTTRAEIDYKGGFVQARRNPAANPHRLTDINKSTVTPVPSSGTTTWNSPDNDFGYRSFYAGSQPERAVATQPSEITSRIPPARLPWNQAGFEVYNEPPELLHDAAVFAPWKYSLETSPLIKDAPATKAEAAVLVAHLPEHALLWVDGQRIALRGETSYFQSPPLPLGKKYSYNVRAAWIELGRWVSMSRKVPVQAGAVQAVFLQQSTAFQTKKRLDARIEASLAKLSPEDRHVASQQKICVVRPDVRLGENGVPIKVMLNNHRVFVCDEKCVKQAEANPDLNWAKAQILRAKNAADSPAK